MTDAAPGSTAVAEPPVTPPPAAPVPPVSDSVEPPAAVVTPPPAAAPSAVPTPPAKAVATAPEPFELEVPKDGLLTKEYVAQFQKDAIAAGLSKDEAKDLLDTQYRAVKEYDGRNKQSLETAKNEWVNESKSAKDIGGDNFNKTTEMSKRVVQAFDTNGEMAKLMNETGFGNYHAVLRFLSKIGSSIGEDRLVAGSVSSGGATKSREEILYGGTTPA